MLAPLLLLNRRPRRLAALKQVRKEIPAMSELRRNGPKVCPCDTAGSTALHENHWKSRGIAGLDDEHLLCAGRHEGSFWKRIIRCHFLLQEVKVVSVQICPRGSGGRRRAILPAGRLGYDWYFGTM